MTYDVATLLKMAQADLDALFEASPPCPWLGRAKQRIGEKLGSRATYGEGIQNVLCAILAGAVLVGLAANTFFALWWLDPAIALAIAAVCVREGQKAWRGEECGCATCS